jgi:hypothetical protein
MVRLTESQQEEALERVREIRVLRMKGLSEDEIAKKLNFTSGLVTNARVMHGQLKRWGFPEWLVYPEGYKASRQREETPESKVERRPKTFGQAEELPRPELAEHIFQKTSSTCVYAFTYYYAWSYVSRRTRSAGLLTGVLRTNGSLTNGTTTPRRSGGSSARSAVRTRPKSLLSWICL